MKAVVSCNTENMAELVLGKLSMRPSVQFKNPVCKKCSGTDMLVLKDSQRYIL